MTQRHSTGGALLRTACLATAFSALLAGVADADAGRGVGIIRVSAEEAGTVQASDTPYHLKTVFRAPEGECFKGNIEGRVLGGHSYMAPCDPGVESDQTWFVAIADEEKGAVLLVNYGQGQPVCLTVDMDDPLYGVRLAECARDEQKLRTQVFLLKEIEGQRVTRIKNLATGDDRCLEGNRFAPDAVMGGAAFMDTCQDVTGQIWFFEQMEY